jgi:hypothetical protein
MIRAGGIQNLSVQRLEDVKERQQEQRDLLNAWRARRLFMALTRV